jgi:hypothetical protein
MYLLQFLSRVDTVRTSDIVVWFCRLSFKFTNAARLISLAGRWLTAMIAIALLWGAMLRVADVRIHYMCTCIRSPKPVGMHIYEGGSKIFRIDAVKILKLTIRPIGRHNPRSSSLPRVDTVSSIFGTLPRSPFLSECQALCDSAWISSVVSNRRPFSFIFIFGNRKKPQGAKSGGYGGLGMTAILYFFRNCWARMEA